ncbi:MAG: hypothetical protein HYZ42_17150, partial [Bacteroidetes bacterium]|nr:hypothetical protein [Bacteroidota bacterium]
TTAGAVTSHNNLVSIGVTLDVNIAASGSLSFCKGDSVKLTASTTNGMGLITYTWNNGGMTDSSIYVNPTVNTTYIATVYAMNACHLGYDSAVIKVLSPANITTQPSNQSGCAGGSESFTVAATGSGLTYQWLKGSTVLTNTGNISGATSATLTINPTVTSDAGTYHVIVKATCGNDTSNNVTLTINAAAAVTTQPSNQSGCAGDSETFTVAATGTGLTYQWMKGSTVLTNTGNISGATSATLTIDPTTASNISASILAFSNKTLTFNFIPKLKQSL